MPWYALPFQEREVQQALSSRFSVMGIPRLVIVGPDGQVGRGSWCGGGTGLIEMQQQQRGARLLLVQAKQLAWGCQPGLPPCPADHCRRCARGGDGGPAGRALPLARGCGALPAVLVSAAAATPCLWPGSSLVPTCQLQRREFVLIRTPAAAPQAAVWPWPAVPLPHLLLLCAVSALRHRVPDVFSAPAGCVLTCTATPQILALWHHSKPTRLLTTHL